MVGTESVENEQYELKSIVTGDTCTYHTDDCDLIRPPKLSCVIGWYSRDVASKYPGYWFGGAIRADTAYSRLTERIYQVSY